MRCILAFYTSATEHHCSSVASIEFSLVQTIHDRFTWVANISFCCITLRHLLLQSGFFGDPVQDCNRVLLHRAYVHFKLWCSAKRIFCSQPNFQEKLVPWQNYCCVDHLLNCFRIELFCSHVVYWPNSVIPEERRHPLDRESIQWQGDHAVAYGNFDFVARTLCPKRWSHPSSYPSHAPRLQLWFVDKYLVI